MYYAFTAPDYLINLTRILYRIPAHEDSYAGLLLRPA